MNTVLPTLLQKLFKDNSLSLEEIVYVLFHLDNENRQALLRYAHQTRLRVYGTKVFLRGLIEFSNICNQNCLYCGIRRDNQNVERYRLTPDEILACCTTGYSYGYRTFVLQSGEDPWFTVGRLETLIRHVKSQCPDAAITLSIGEREWDTYKRLFEAGANRYLLRHETAAKDLYQRFHPGMLLSHRVQCLRWLKAIGYQVGAGFMVGLPGQVAEHLALDLAFLHELQPDMVGIGPFIPHRSTPLKHAAGGTVVDTLVMLALTRLLLPESLLPATTAIGTLHPLGRERALQAGANVLMPNLSPVVVRRKYQLYKNKICTDEASGACLDCIKWRVQSAGFDVDMSRGDSLGAHRRSAWGDR